MNARIRRKGLWVALAAAYMLVLQSLIGAFTMGAGAHAAGLDAFGNPLCITGTGLQESGSPGSHHDVPGCCLTGCGAAFVATPGLPTAPSIASPLASIIVASAPGPSLPFATSCERKQSRPRAPPAAI